MQYSLLVFCLASVAPLSAQVAQNQPTDLAVNVDGKPFTIFHYGADANKPFLAPLRSVSGKIITRGFPMENIPGESRDHLHHRGLWFSYDDVNGVKFWENDPSYTRPNIGKITVTHAEVKEGKGSSTVTAGMDWRGPNYQLLLVEDREMVFRSAPNLRTIDFRITLTAPNEDVIFGDTKEGAFAIRLSDAFTERKGLNIVDADGRTRMVNVWGKRSNWVDYSADVDGEKIGVAMFDHPQNPNHPTYWHARDYGLFALDPFGQNAFDPKMEVRRTVLTHGDKLVYRWRVVIHPGDAETSHIAGLYKEYAAKP
jgi:hypothetical protein